jgi:hypothetical protein
MIDLVYSILRDRGYELLSWPRQLRREFAVKFPAGQLVPIDVNDLLSSKPMVLPCT